MQNLNIKSRLKNIFIIFSNLCVFVFPAIAFARGETPVSDGLSYITNAMYGATGVAIATIAVMSVGLLCMGHILKWTALGYTIMGVSIIFGAGSIVKGITALTTTF
ncbi:MAG: TrbC/VirB2 family protein [Gammaproteobacteria bacterium]